MRDSMSPKMIHCLKTWPKFWHLLVSGAKRFELRRNDRDFIAGDCLVLQEFNPPLGMDGHESTLLRSAWTGRMLVVRVTCVVSEFMPDGFVALGIEPWTNEAKP